MQMEDTNSCTEDTKNALEHNLHCAYVMRGHICCSMLNAHIQVKLIELIEQHQTRGGKKFA